MVFITGDRKKSRTRDIRDGKQTNKQTNKQNEVLSSSAFCYEFIDARRKGRDSWLTWRYLRESQDMRVKDYVLYWLSIAP
jgi:RecB family exonuclease